MGFVHIKCTVRLGEYAWESSVGGPEFIWILEEKLLKSTHFFHHKKDKQREEEKKKTNEDQLIDSFSSQTSSFGSQLLLQLM